MQLLDGCIIISLQFAIRMNDSEFTALIKTAKEAAELHFKLTGVINDECIRRHGCTYNQAEAESIIDTLDYGQGNIDSAEKFDEDMKFSLQRNLKP